MLHVQQRDLQVNTSTSSAHELVDYEFQHPLLIMNEENHSNRTVLNERVRNFANTWHKWRGTQTYSNIPDNWYNVNREVNS